MSGNYPPGLTQRGFDEAHDNLGLDPDAVEKRPNQGFDQPHHGHDFQPGDERGNHDERVSAFDLEPCDHCHGAFDPVELRRIVNDYLCPDCWAAYVTDWPDAPDETLADKLSYRQRVL